eukprot:RCo036603
MAGSAAGDSERRQQYLAMLCAAFDIPSSERSSVEKIFENCDGDEEQVVPSLRALSTTLKARAPSRGSGAAALNPAEAIPFHNPDRRGVWRCPVCLFENSDVEQCEKCTEDLLPAIDARPSRSV